MAKVDTTSFTKFGQSMRAAGGRVKNVVSQSLVDVAPKVVATAKVNASFSKKIPDTITSVPIDVGVMIVAGGPSVPEAELYENKGVPGKWRHPLFGNTQHWYSQTAHPFLAPAVLASTPKVEEAVLEAVDTLFEGVASETAI
jgi:hypothetical protein